MVEGTAAQNRITFRMSEAGECIRSLSAKYLGYEPEARPDWLQTAADEGKWHEERLVQEINKDNAVVYDRQLEVKIKQTTFTLLGHIDGKVDYWKNTKVDNTKLLEIKSMSQYEFDRWMKGKFNEFPEYADQIACYMKATGLSETAYYVKNRSSGYIDKDIIRLGDIACDDCDFGQRLIIIFDKLETVAKHVVQKELVPAVCDMSSLQCRRCFYKYLCVKAKEDMSVQEETVLRVAANNWRKGKELEKASKELIEASKKTFEEHTIASELKSWRFEELAISNVEVKEHEIPARLQKAYSYVRIDDIKKEE